VRSMRPVWRASIRCISTVRRPVVSRQKSLGLWVRSSSVRYTDRIAIVERFFRILKKVSGVTTAPPPNLTTTPGTWLSQPASVPNVTTSTGDSPFFGFRKAHLQPGVVNGVG
jgi:hypothetical protein